MKAIIKVYLVNPTRSGNSVIVTKTKPRKKELMNEVINDANNFIFERVNNKNFIRVKKFEVSIVDYRNREVKKYEYIPTYN